MEFNTRTLLFTVEGEQIGDITQYLFSGKYSRKHKGRGSGQVTISDECQWLDEINIYDSMIFHETLYEDDTRDFDYGGIVTNVREHQGQVEVLSNDRSVLWAREIVNRLKYDEQDVAFLAEGFLKQNMGGFYPRSVQTYPAGVSSSIDVKQGTLTSAVIDSLVGLSWTFVGDTLMLFGFGNPNNDFTNLDFTFLTVKPVIEQIGNLYANHVQVLGNGVIGNAELPNITSRISRSISVPEISVQSVADNAARELLNQVSRKWYINLDDNIPLNMGKFNDKIIDLVPGIFVDVKAESRLGLSADRFILDSVNVDVIANTVDIGLTSFGRPEESNG